MSAEPSPAERARTVAAATTVGVLSTVALDPPGTPSASLTRFELDDDGTAVLHLAAGAQGARDLQADARASLLVADPRHDPGDHPSTPGSVTLLGRAEHLGTDTGTGDAGGRSRWRLRVEAVRWVGGDGTEVTIDPADWAAARPDPVAPFAAPVVEHLNDDHADSCLLLVRTLGGRAGATEAVAVGVDRYGLDLVARGPAGSERVRIGFDEPVQAREEVRMATVALVRRAEAQAATAS